MAMPQIVEVKDASPGNFCSSCRMPEVKTQSVEETIKNFINKTNCDQSFFVADFSDIVYKYRYWRSKLPKVEPFYAVKCNSDPMLLRLMVALGMRFDCASQGEINCVLTADAHPSDIIFAHPFKSIESLRYADTVGVDFMTFDCENEMMKISRIFPHARLVLRIKIPEVPAGFPLSDKFGCELKHAKHLLVIAQEHKLNVIGVSFHVGSLCQQPSAFYKAIVMARQVFDSGRDLGMHFNLLDLGGGFPGATETYDIFDEMCYFIKKGLEEHFPEGCGVRVIAEPGCYMVNSAFTLCTKVLGKKMLDIESEDKDSGVRKKKAFYYLNDGIHGSFIHGFEMYGYHIKPLLSQSELATRPHILCKLWGTTSDEHDYILEDVLISELEVGDYIVFDNMGAYTQCFSTNFNGFTHPQTKYIFPPQCMMRNDNLPSFDEFCHELSSSQLKTLKEIQDHISQYDSSEDSLFEKEYNNICRP